MVRSKRREAAVAVETGDEMKRLPGHPGRLVSWFRNLLAGRQVDAAPWLRTTQVVSTRSPDPPNLPPGPAHRLADNYYCSRDLRRGVQPPTMVSSQKQLADASEAVTSEEVAYPQITTPPTPGIGHRWTWKQS